MNTPVSFELAKLLKEKGINIPSNRGLGVAIYEDGKITSTCLYDGTVIHAPTIAEVVMWLYEKHGIWINVGGDCDYKFKFEIHTWNWYEHEKTYRLGHIVLGESFFDTSSEPFNSPTEAYEAAILYILNNLI